MSDQSRGNSGIIGNVTGEIVVTGDYSQGNKTTNISQTVDFISLIEQLRNAVDKINLDPIPRNVVNTEIDAIQTSLNTAPIDPTKVGLHISGLSEKLKMVGVFVGSLATVAEPLKKIMDLVHIQGKMF